MDKGGDVVVVCRFRPENKREIELGTGTCMKFIDS